MANTPAEIMSSWRDEEEHPELVTLCGGIQRWQVEN